MSVPVIGMHQVGHVNPCTTQVIFKWILCFCLLSTAKKKSSAVIMTKIGTWLILLFYFLLKMH